METTSTPTGGSLAPRPARRRTSRRTRRAVWIGVALAVVALIVVAWWPKPVPVETALARRGPLRVTVDEDGRARVRDRYVVSAPLSGTLARVTLEAGDAVDAGAVLARIAPLATPLLDPRAHAEAESRLAAARAASLQARTAVDRARIAAAHARADADRDASLRAHGTLSPEAAEHTALEARLRGEELASAQFAARVAAYEVETAAAALGRFDGPSGPRVDVASPVAGRVLRVVRESEGAVQAGAPLVELGDPAALDVVVDVLSTDAVRIPPGARAWLERWGGDAPLAAHVRRVEPSAFTRVSALGVDEQRVNVILDLDDPRERWARLGDGYRVEARIVVWEAPDALAVPASAVFRARDGWAVFVVERGRARLRAVEPGHRGGGDVEIRRGLAPGERVVLYPGDRVRDGVRVAPR